MRIYYCEELLDVCIFIYCRRSDSHCFVCSWVCSAAQTPVYLKPCKKNVRKVGFIMRTGIQNGMCVCLVFCSNCVITSLPSTPHIYLTDLETFSIFRGKVQLTPTPTLNFHTNFEFLFQSVMSPPIILPNMLSTVCFVYNVCGPENTMAIGMAIINAVELSFS